MPTKNRVYKDVEVEVEVDLDDFTDEDLIEELASRNIRYNGYSLIQKIHDRRKLGQDYQRELDSLIYESLGRIL